MPLSNKWWILCAVSLSCLLRLGSCRRNRAHGGQPELFIFNELCALKDEPGPCKAIKDRYFFNVNTGSCQLFEYGGCGGNDNNFETLEDCEETCVVSEDKDPCHLGEAPGPCRGLVRRYFFDSQSQRCRHFFYGGCFGNANNFRSMADCQAKCQNPAKPTTAPEVHTHSARRADAVQPTIEAAKPTTAPEVHTHSARRADAVQPTIETGEQTVSEPLVQVNHSKVEKQDMTPSELCFSPEDRGTCTGAERRFAYNPRTKRCQMFSYSGCGGNRNNFTSRKHCIHKCIRSKKGRRMIRIRKKNINSIANRSV